MKTTSKKPHYIRMYYAWIIENNLTPYLLVNADFPDVEVPHEHVNAGRIVLNISPQACRGLHLENDHIVFTARFSGQTMQISLHPGAVLAIYSKETGEGKEFGREYDEPYVAPTSKKTTTKKPALTLVKQDRTVD